MILRLVGAGIPFDQVWELDTEQISLYLEAVSLREIEQQLNSLVLAGYSTQSKEDRQALNQEIRALQHARSKIQSERLTRWQQATRSQ